MATRPEKLFRRSGAARLDLHRPADVLGLLVVSRSRPDPDDRQGDERKWGESEEQPLHAGLDGRSGASGFSRLRFRSSVPV